MSAPAESPAAGLGAPARPRAGRWPMWRAAAGALLSHWRRHPGQAATLVLGLALATALWTGVQAINAEARASYAEAADLVTQNNAPVLVARDGGVVALADYVALRRDGWPVAPVIEGTARFDGIQVTLLGLDPLSTPVLPEAGAVGDGDGLAEFIGPPGQVFAEAGTAGRLAGRLAPVELVVSQDVAPGTLVGDISTMARLLERPDTLTRLAMVAEPPAGTRPLEALAPGLVRSEPVASADIGGLTGSFHLNLTAFGMLSFTVGLFIVHGAIGLAFEQRRGMFRTLRALGLPARALIGLLAAELALMTLIAGAIGVAIGYGIAAALLPDVAATLRGIYGTAASGTLVLRPGWVAAGFAMAAFGTAIAAAQSLHRLIRLPILAGAQPRAWRLASETSLRRQALAGVALVALAAVTGLFASGLVAGFVLLGALMLGAALILPPVLAMGLRAAGARARSPLAQWFWADTRQQLPGLSLALMALLLALAANIGVSTMVGSFRTTFTGWLDQRLAAEVYGDAGSEAVAGDIERGLQGRIDAFLPRALTEARIDGRAGQVQALADHATYRENWPLIDAAPAAWETLAAGAGLFVNEQFSHASGLDVGDRVTVDGKEWQILAVYSDYGNPRPQAIMGLETFASRYPDVPRTRFGLRADPADVPELRATLIDEYGLPPDRVVDQDSLKALSLQIFERTFAVTGALNVLTLGIAGVAIFTSLATLAGQRLPQVAPVWAIGLTRARLGGLEMARAVTLAAMTALLALPVGLVLAWVLLAVVNVEAFGWRLPMKLFPGDWARLTLLALVAALAAAALPAWRIARRPPADLLRVFASER